MTNPRLIEELGDKLSDILARSPARDVEKNVRALLAAFFDRFDLVTREDFEVQKRVLERTRTRITELEKRIGELEAAERSGQAPQ
jgi:ubiquinone biosynthesis accessory factor UbiK